MIKKGNKLPGYYDDVVDIQLKKWIDLIHPTFKRMGFTPNMITTLSLLFGLIMSYLYYKQYYVAASFCCLLSYFFDVMDGYFARLYHMGSTFGSYYDVVSDWVTSILLFILFLLNPLLSLFIKGTILTCLTVLSVLIAYHFSCQEKYTEHTNKKHVSKGLLFLTPIQCHDFEHMKYTRYFGSGTLFLFISVVILMHPFLLSEQ